MVNEIIRVLLSGTPDWFLPGPLIRLPHLADGVRVVRPAVSAHELTRDTKDMSYVVWRLARGALYGVLRPDWTLPRLWWTLPSAVIVCSSSSLPHLLCADDL